MRRRTKIWLFVAALLAGLFLWMRPANVGMDILSVAQDEIARIESQGFDLPDFTLTTVSPLGWNAVTVISDRPVRYSVVLVRWAFADEGQIRRSTGHEVGHMLLAKAGLPSTETDADAFAYCFGSKLARADAERLGKVSKNCGDIAKALHSGFSGVSSGIPHQ